MQEESMMRLLQNIDQQVAQRIGSCLLNFAFIQYCIKYHLKGWDLFLLLEHYIHSIYFAFQNLLRIILTFSSGGSPPGLSIAQANRVTGKNPLKSEVILTMKVKLVDFKIVSCGHLETLSWSDISSIFSKAVGNLECHWSYGAGSWTCLSFICVSLCRLVHTYFSFS